MSTMADLTAGPSSRARQHDNIWPGTFAAVRTAASARRSRTRIGHRSQSPPAGHCVVPMQPQAIR
ncbi:hypothetical protein BD309DRAFT_868445 [Dichomitus squalens]|uniref:Uncharacterized protein n=2 Tax=Dichomitus squalens TaxID=114155 RepID=A0A4Q9MDV0_9APHY|nr:uncharacterized protein DICSQDRAFT_157948 [Dichomitus squalens LYAD-421 SS1]EJF56277.1 hypothetical protein DICSQDRAFT_157948 [Dichomitus squalens LYAD-421 SS1]TBU24777.1 hypothetical protein BD311DRAFT_790763 [Dichomitus squalens]TBU41368.1 hypothetical protein BD309DRAFT_868445 [Dichomitus squalens]TBU57031.1 hypothetical protein BD310DRAFT_822344 [Dichomitus squalens]